MRSGVINEDDSIRRCRWQWRRIAIVAAGQFEDMASALSSLEDNDALPLRPRQIQR